jgi:hypothetical protein
MIPRFTETGHLPSGIHHVPWTEFDERFGHNARRKELLGGLKALLSHLKSVRCRALYVDGSFVTAKELPNDYDACWDVEGVKVEKLDKVLLSFSDEGKRAMQDKYCGDIRPGSCSPEERDCTYLEFFQMGRDGEPKGIIKLVLAEFKP